MLQFVVTWVVFLLPLLVKGLDENRGYPLFFGSFGDVGPSEIDREVRAVGFIDDKITEWTRDCPADAFLLIKDSTPFQLTGMKKMQRLGENSLTRGSFLTDYLVNLRELALDLEEYCEGRFIEILPSTNLTELPKPVDVQARIFYVEFDKDFTPMRKDEVLTEVLARIASPFVTVVYTSTFQQTHPILRSLSLNPNRKSWQKSKLKLKKDHIAPIVAPLFSKNTGHHAPEAQFELPDNFFLTLLLGSVLGVALLAYRDIQSWLSRRKTSRPISKPASTEIDDTESKQK